MAASRAAVELIRMVLAGGRHIGTVREFALTFRCSYAAVVGAVEELAPFGCLELKPYGSHRGSWVIRSKAPTIEVRQQFQHILEADAASQGKSAVTTPPVVRPDRRMEKLQSDADKVSRTRVTVLIMGEAGAGKGVWARRIHTQSDRVDRPFVTIDCAAIPDSLLESNLFGHERGAFTGAVERQRSLVEVANGGTVFLDEVGELPLAAQAKFLRLLETRRFIRVGGTEEIHVDVRFILATNRPLLEMVAARDFRLDLYQRMSGIVLTIPPLRERRGEIPSLVSEMMAVIPEQEDVAPRTISAAAIQVLEAYAWPGNVRELRQVLVRALILAEGAEITADDISSVLEDTPRPPSQPIEVRRPLREIAAAHMIAVYEHVGRDVNAAADILEVHRSTLYRRLRECGVVASRKM